MGKRLVLFFGAISVFVGLLAEPALFSRGQGKDGEKGEKKKFRPFKSIQGVWIDGEEFVADQKYNVTSGDIDIRVETGQQLGVDAAKVYIQVVEGDPASIEDLPGAAPQAILQTAADGKRYWVRYAVPVTPDADPGKKHTFIVWSYFRNPPTGGTAVETLYQRTQGTFFCVTYP